MAIPALTGLASQAGFAAVGLGTLVVAAQGVGDALKAVNDAALEPTAANLEKAQQAMAKLGPEAQAFVTRFQELRPVLGDIRDAAAAGWFPGITEALDSLESAAPRIESLFQVIGETGGNLIAEGAASLAGPEWAEFIQFVEDNAPQALDELGRTVGNLTKGLANMWMAFDPLNDDFSAWLLEQSRAFAEWSDGLAENQGFQEFVAYIRESGPKVAAALSAVGDAVLEIVEALAPLGGPSLKIIETFARAIGNIADSDMGTPIYGAVAALLAYNRVLKMSIGLQKAMGLSSATAAAGMGGGKGGLFGGKGIKGAAGPAAILGGITLASTDLGASLTQTNAASLALAGTWLGPWGAAAGLAVGGLLDVAAANNAVMDSIARGDLKQAAADLKALKDEVDMDPGKKGFGEAFLSGLPGGSLLTDGAGIKNMVEGFFGQSDVQEAEWALMFANIAAAGRKSLGELQTTAGASNTALGALFGGLDQAAMAAENLSASVASVNAVLTKQGSWDAYQASIDNLTASIAENGKTLDSNTESGRANRAALNDIAASALAYAETLEGADKIDFLKNARKAFVQGAKDAGGLDARAKDVLASLDAMIALPPIAPKVDSSELTGAKAATGALAGALVGLSGVTAKPKADLNKAPFDATKKNLDNALAGIDGRRVNVTVGLLGYGAVAGALASLTRPRTVTVNTVTTGAMIGRSGGGYTGHGGKYEPAGIVHRGEVVIPQELVVRDRDLLKQRYGHLPGMESLASGGLAGFTRSSSLAGIPGLVAIDQTAHLSAKSLRAEMGVRKNLLQKELDASKSKLEAMKAETDALKESVKARFTDSIWGNSSSTQLRDLSGLTAEQQVAEINAWKTVNANLNDPVVALQNQILQAQSLAQMAATLQSKGLNGAAYSDLMNNGSLDQIGMMATQSPAYLAQIERLYNVRGHNVAMAQSVATAPMVAQQAATNAAIARLEAQQKATNKSLAAISKGVTETGPARTGVAVGRAINNAAVVGKKGRS